MLAQKLDKYVEHWDSASEKLISENVHEISSDDYFTERTMRRVVNL